AKTVAAECRSASALEVQARSVHEDEVEPREQVAPMREQPLLDHVLAAARRKRRAAVLLLLRQFLAQPRHRAIEMVQVESGNAVDRIVVLPALGGTVGAAHKQPMQ